ncbi:MAG: hypothetical protein ACLR0R_12705 [[Ruminococcus] lactaris]|uniref:hypothetical protein n=1 Tax=[Ruminococcus] lactaris TaxID=46228 RepID=UPI0039A32BED
MPELSTEKMLDFLRKRARNRPEKTAEHFLTGLFHKKLSGLWLKFARIPKEKKSGNSDGGRTPAPDLADQRI